MAIDIDWNAVKDRILSKENLISAALTGGLGYGLYRIARDLPGEMLDTKSDRKEYRDFSKGLKDEGITIVKQKGLKGNAFGNGSTQTVTIPARNFRSLPVLAHEAGHASSSELEQLSTRADNILKYGLGPKPSELLIPDRVSAAAGLFNTVRGFIGGPNAYRDMIAAAAASNALYIPRAIGEIGASARGAAKVYRAGGGIADQLGAFGGVPSHMYTAILPWMPILGKVTYEWLSKRK